jgi:hypothetical protein
MRSAAASLRASLNAGLLVAGALSMVSGFLVQVRYHMGHGASAGRIVWGWPYPTWALFHQISSAAMLALATWHLYLNRKPLLAILSRNGAWRRQGPFLFSTFAAAVATALLAWAAAVGFDHHFVERVFVELHDKIVIAMSVLLVLHVWQRRSRLLSRPRSMG